MVEQDHVHSWQPNGIVRVKSLSASPVSHAGCVVYDKAYSVTVCTCGDTKTTYVANENDRSGYIKGRGYVCVIEGMH